MSVYTSSPINMQTNYITDPNNLLLEVRSTLILDSDDVAGSICDRSEELFFPPVRGVYRPNDFRPLIVENEKLFTHKSTYDFFPEISSQVYQNIDSKWFLKYCGEVGKRVNWRDAVENKINVYNAHGRLILRSNDNRKGYVFNPGPEIYLRQFIIDLTKYFIHDLVPWGDVTKSIQSVKNYINHELDAKEVIEDTLVLICTTSYFKAVTEMIKKDPWLIYHVNNIGGNVLVEAGCDYRHFKCNQVLWDQELQKNNGNYDDIHEIYNGAKVYKPGEIKFEDLDDFFACLKAKTNYPVHDLSSFFALLDASKINKKQSKTIVDTIDTFLQTKNNKVTQSTKLIDKIIRRHNEHSGFNFNEASGIYFL